MKVTFGDGKNKVALVQSFKLTAGEDVTKYVEVGTPFVIENDDVLCSGEITKVEKKPKFKPGDKVRVSDSPFLYTILEVLPNIEKDGRFRYNVYGYISENATSGYREKVMEWNIKHEGGS
jgi:hypothetical protein